MIDRLLPVGRLLLLVLTTTVIVLSFCGVPFTHAAGGTCVSARVVSPFRLPDGALHPAGMLTVCRTRTFSPVADLHLISVDHRPMGMFLSRSRRAEGVRATAPEIVFRRDVRGNLDLLGYTMPTRGRSLVHRLGLPPIEVADGEGLHGLPTVAALAR
ncbi:MAG TPA: hypothetical protein VFV75_14610 [Candidatus Polarisedimenticolaceae bacterium]|nr:hypothetical protein [Candidatus Polarisedimenticolaceae bacterium]